MGTLRPGAVRFVGNRYRLLQPYAQGGTGMVWQAQDDRTGDTVAIRRVLLSGLSQSEQAVLGRRTLAAAQAARQLRHPHAVAVLDVIADGDQPWVVTELLADPESLSEEIRRMGSLHPGRVAEIGLAVLGALDAAHAAGILHTDVKPGNVLIAGDGRIALTDFGLATLTGDPALAGSGLLLGANAFLAPERAQGAPAGPAGDLWSLGATIYAAVEGRPPYHRRTPAETVAAIAIGDPPRPQRAGPLGPVLAGLLERDPRRRVDAAGARKLLQRAFAEAGGPPAPLPATVPGPPMARRRKGHPRTWPVPAAGVLIIGAIMTGSVIYGLGGLGRNPSSVPDLPPAVLATPPASVISPDPASTVIPPGFATYRDPGGWSVAVPRNWSRQCSGTECMFTDPAGAMTLTLTTDIPAQRLPVDLLGAQDIAQGQQAPGYQKLGLAQIYYRKYPAASWEYVSGRGNDLVHTLVWMFQVGARDYQIAMSASQARWQSAEPAFKVAANTLRPAS